MKTLTPEFDSLARFTCRERYFDDLKTFSVDFCIRYAECPPYFYFRSTWPTDLESVLSPRTTKISTKVEADTTIRCLVTAFLLLIHYVALWPWPFDLGQWSYMACYMVNPSTKFEAPIRLSIIDLWVLTLVHLTWPWPRRLQVTLGYLAENLGTTRPRHQ